MRRCSRRWSGTARPRRGARGLGAGARHRGSRGRGARRAGHGGATRSATAVGAGVARDARAASRAVGGGVARSVAPRAGARLAQAGRRSRSRRRRCCRLKRLDEAEARITHWLARVPGDPQAEALLGQLAARTAPPADAVTHLGARALDHRDDPALWFALGSGEHCSGTTSGRARQAFEHTLALDPRDYESWLRLAWCAARAGRSRGVRGRVGARRRAAGRARRSRRGDAAWKSGPAHEP